MSSIKSAVYRFHNDERGFESLQTVMIMAVAAVALLAVKEQWGNIKEFFDTQMKDVTNAEEWTNGAKSKAGE
ncbi:hypothetical protein OAS39_10260 [Pirellulales bacterium]|nr:hypothetical protein [Pirellulales bacterium]